MLISLVLLISYFGRISIYRFNWEDNMLGKVDGAEWGWKRGCCQIKPHLNYFQPFKAWRVGRFHKFVDIFQQNTNMFFFNSTFRGTSSWKLSNSVQPEHLCPETGPKYSCEMRFYEGTKRQFFSFSGKVQKKNVNQFQAKIETRKGKKIGWFDGGNDINCHHPSKLKT